jgi:nitrate reductase NapAB chaperone NapD
VSCRDDVEVIGRAVVLVVEGMSQEFLVVHVPEVRSLNGVVGIKGVGDPMFTIIVIIEGSDGD